MLDHKLSETLFRKEAINYINSARVEETHSIVIGRKYWLYLFSTLAFLASVIYWIGYYPMILQVQSKGIVLDHTQLMNTQHNIEKTLQEKNNAARDLLDLVKNKSDLFTKGYLTKPELMNTKQSYLAAEQELRLTERNLMGYSTNNSLTSCLPVIISLINYDDSKKIAVGAQSYIHIVSAHSTSQDIPAHVIYRSSQPITKELAAFYYANSRNTDYYYPDQPAALFVIQPDQVKLLAGTNVVIKTSYNACSIWKILTKSDECD